ncbi:histidine kinase [Bowmanella sp. Y26]|uniref:histidine kinase n=1 Tax=Bowmanella yangjiangensis TaxID=2811230 RepID=UPI001BDD1CAB|nr:histidine kinase [Bowmanella yangjiangensis]MBT1064422.1 histidine kinase [Bowmanella yangjiangensis]
MHSHQGPIHQLVHDARRPLNNISMQAELLKLLANKGADESQLIDAADKIVRYCKECSQILEAVSEQAEADAASAGRRPQQS